LCGVARQLRNVPLITHPISIECIGCMSADARTVNAG